MTDFGRFKEAVSARWAAMAEHDLYRAAVEGDELWATYLASFPEGSNPVFRERTEHDCSCCRQFIRAVGDAVALVDGAAVSLWDLDVGDPAYQAVADAMAALVRSRPIRDVFLHPEENAGTDHNFEGTGDRGAVRRWDHFHVRIPSRRNSGRNYVVDKARIPTELGERRATHDVLMRGLVELTRDSIDTVLEIIDQGSLYRGAEFRGAVKAFGDLKAVFDRTPEEGRDARVWGWTYGVSPAIARTRNTAIGTLLIDLSAGTDLEDAVRRFETSIMAPTNYKRPTALVSQRMVDQAREEVERLGLASALERRHARLADVSVNDVIFADRSAKMVMRDGDAFEGIATRAPARDLSRVEAVPIDRFLSDVVPHASSIEVLLENRHAGNLVSLVAPASPEAKPLFKWGNGFSWSYNGDVADSIRERVKRAGGDVTGDLCCRLAWHNHDDLDLHMQEPRSGRFPGHHIHFAAKISPTTGGRLDVDMNAGHGTTREPVENIFYRSRGTMVEGTYVLSVHQYNRREVSDVGFEVEVDYLGQVASLAYDRAVVGTVEVAQLTYTHAGGLQLDPRLPHATSSKEIWGLRTNDFHRVSALMLSPNHWEGAGGVGNMHFMFMLDGCVNEGGARGFYNEFLRPELDRHRKVIEIVGAKMRARETPDQLSGLGFSDTQHTELVVRVSGSFNRTLRVQI